MKEGKNEPMFQKMLDGIDKWKRDRESEGAEVTFVANFNTVKKDRVVDDQIVMCGDNQNKLMFIGIMRNIVREEEGITRKAEMIKYVKFYTTWDDKPWEKIEGSVYVECRGLKAKEHSETLGMLEAENFEIYEMDAQKIIASKPLLFKELLPYTKSLLAKGFELMPGEEV